MDHQEPALPTESALSLLVLLFYYLWTWPVYAVFTGLSQFKLVRHAMYSGGLHPAINSQYYTVEKKNAKIKI